MRRAGWLAFGIGGFVGMCAPVGYLMVYGTFSAVPAWAEIAFWPGFFMGDRAYVWSHSDSNDWNRSINLGIVVGCITVSLCYGVAAWIGYAIVARCRRGGNR
jgi:hypothetical protein